MTTQQIAEKWAAYCRSGQMDNAQEELYADNCVSLEMEGAEGFPTRVEGIAGIREKGQQWMGMVEEFHGVEIEGPLVAGNYFTATLKMDITMKGMPRRIDEEVAIYRVEDGKIVSEQFFYALT